jgi:hypothetical protein
LKGPASGLRFPASGFQEEAFSIDQNLLYGSGKDETVRPTHTCIRAALRTSGVSSSAASRAEQTFRFNNRKDMNDGQRFALAMSQIDGKRLTYTELTGKDQSPRHEVTGTRETQVPF